MFTHINILGAPGSGVTTLGKALAGRLGYAFFDTDDYYWFTTDALPYRRKRNPQHRLQLLTADLDQSGPFVVSGSLLGWGEVLGPRFDLTVLRWLPETVRAARIRQRELQRYGPQRLSPDGDLHGVYVKFLHWAMQYDQTSENPRSRVSERAWVEKQSSSRMYLEEDEPVEDLVERICAFAQTGP